MHKNRGLNADLLYYACFITFSSDRNWSVCKRRRSASTAARRSRKERLIGELTGVGSDR
jgi:hypothetical protein